MVNPKILGIDATNIRGGGGVTHLVELLRAANPEVFGFSKIFIWGSRETLNQIEDRSWLIKNTRPLLNKNLLLRTFWQVCKLSSEVRSFNCDLLFVPGGSYAGNFHPVVTFSQNLLPFDWVELKRFGWSMMTLKFILLRFTQGWTFLKADGVIFLSSYAKNMVLNVIKTPISNMKIIPHGIDERFTCLPRKQRSIQTYTSDNPFRILYVSVIEVYKHPWHVAAAVFRLRKMGMPVSLEFVGPISPTASERFKKTLDNLDPDADFLKYKGPLPHNELHNKYIEADLFVFASSCETFGQILTEAMSAGLPIACSKRSSLPEILGEAGVYFDPESEDEITQALETLIKSTSLRTEKAKASFDRARNYSWNRCAKETFQFLQASLNNSNKS